jgi:DNA-binding transcriptional LysR family regulator
MDVTALTNNRQFHVLSPRTWRVADTMLRYRMVLAGVRWTHFARAWIAADIAAGRLVELRSEKNAPSPSYTVRAFYRISAPQGPAGPSTCPPTMGFVTLR